ncbi:hypothetical protein R3P38DRAFT_2810294 [Favolaschia claudopus]|uniref:Uncharacterized protein n=1 Tax=Favolaschia claudopus TaxID=2862362 RepID=A0AAV9ZAW7_9AGAR
MTASALVQQRYHSTIEGGGRKVTEEIKGSDRKYSRPLQHARGIPGADVGMIVGGEQHSTSCTKLLHDIINFKTRQFFENTVVRLPPDCSGAMPIVQPNILLRVMSRTRYANVAHSLRRQGQRLRCGGAHCIVQDVAKDNACGAVVHITLCKRMPSSSSTTNPPFEILRSGQYWADLRRRKRDCDAAPYPNHRHAPSFHREPFEPASFDGATVVTFIPGRAQPVTRVQLSNGKLLPVADAAATNDFTTVLPTPLPKKKKRAAPPTYNGKTWQQHDQDLLARLNACKARLPKE